MRGWRLSCEIKAVSVAKQSLGRNALSTQESKHVPMKVSFLVGMRVDFALLMHTPRWDRSSYSELILTRRQAWDSATKSQSSSREKGSCPIISYALPPR